MENKKITNTNKGAQMVLKGKTNQNDLDGLYNNRYLVRADGTIRSTNDWYGKDTKNHIYAADLKTARAKAKKLNLTKEAA
tara:strand:+ start:1184 stop:1423 length:240 start_codon:yes stop_codon:yes gene_type:complete